VKIESFTKIDSWKEARELVNEIYKSTTNGKFSKDYGLRDQIQRAAVSIMSNIAEGFDSGSKKSFITFLNYSYRSASEVESLLFIALDLDYIDNEIFNYLMQKTKKIKSLIGGFIKYLKNDLNH
jgi:four helix bundle protein